MVRIVCATTVLIMVAFNEPALASAGTFNFNLGLFKFDYNPVRHEPNQERKLEEKNAFTFFSLGGCYYVVDQVCVGAKTMQGTRLRRTSQRNADGSTSQGKTESEWSATGLSVGYKYDAWRAMLTYYLNAQRLDKDGAGATRMSYSGGTAYQIDIGYGFAIGNIHFGPMLSLMDFSYDKFKAGSTERDLSGYSDSLIVPYFSLWFGF